MCLSVQCLLNQTVCILLCSLLWPDWLPQRTKNAFSALSLSQCCLLLLVFFFKSPCVLCCGSVCGDKKRRLDALRLELQAAGNFPTDLRSIWESGKHSSLLNPSLQPQGLSLTTIPPWCPHGTPSSVGASGELAYLCHCCHHILPAGWPSRSWANNIGASS